MNTERSRSRGYTRCLIVLPAIIVGLSLTFTAEASAQTAVPFQASVNAITPKPKPCSTGDWCGSASIGGYGAATWSFSPDGGTGTSGCFPYTATSTFTLGDGSTLVLDENGLACGAGANQPPNAFGDPINSKNSSWTVQSATGQFNGLTGSGTDALRLNGPRLYGTYSGTLLGP